MDTSKERKLIEETFVLAFASSLQVDAPAKDVVEHFVSFVISKRIAALNYLPNLPIDERFIYSSIPEFINYLQGGHK